MQLIADGNFLVTMKRSSARYTFQQFNSEINELYEFLKSEKYKEEKIKQIFFPLTSIIEKSNTFSFFSISIVVLISLYFFSFFDIFYWHICAVGRIFLIKALPLFDWRYLKNKPCLIDTFNVVPNDFNLSLNCDVCESIKNIHVYEDIDEDVLIQKYLELDVPLILTKGLEMWPKNSNFVDDVIKADLFYYSYPCKISTNIQKKTSPVGELLGKVKNFDEFFLHFQNCDLEAMRVFRRYTYRPKFLPPTYSPISYNWLIWNKNYNATNYKTIALVDKVSVFGQLFGKSYVRLIPRLNCFDICPILNVVLSSGESLIFTNLWDLEYIPNEEGENIAVILETKD